MRCALALAGLSLLGFLSNAVAQQPGAQPTPTAQGQAHSSHQAKIAKHRPSAQHARSGASQTQNNTAVASDVSLNSKPAAYSAALRRYHHQRHDRVWWRSHFNVIVLVRGGYYYWDAGYWCPAWGYDSAYQYYDY